MLQISWVHGQKFGNSVSKLWSWSYDKYAHLYSHYSYCPSDVFFLYKATHPHYSIIQYDKMLTPFSPKRQPVLCE